VDWKSYAQLWQSRAEECELALRTPLFLSPTLLKRREAELAEGMSRGEKAVMSSEFSLLIGELAHRFLQDWNFNDDPSRFREKLEPFLDRWVGSKQQANRGQLQREVEEIFDPFFSSAAYRELSSSLILGREVPLLIPWDGQIMEGLIDLLYEREGLLYLADYKTDRAQKKDLLEAAESYRHQVRIYSEAARRSLKREVVGFRLIFLRTGEALEVLP